MDINVLSKKEFNAVQWINENFKKHKEEIKNSTTEDCKKTDINSSNEIALEFINSYLMKLQLHVQQTNYAVEESTQEILTNMPRVVKEAQSLQTDVEQLRQRMLEMHQEVAAVQEETGECMTTLERLNTIQIKLQNAKESLQESDGWGNLIAGLEDCFEKNDLKGVCDKIVALQKSLLAQEQLPGHTERLSQVEDFKNRLEALASPNVVQCFSGGSVSDAQRYVSIFAAIKRTAQLLQYYRAVQKTSLQQQWKQILDLQNTDNATQQCRFLSVFYDHLLENCRQQVKWCAQVFEESDTQQQPFLVLAELLPALQPTRDQFILQIFKTCNERLDLLLQFARDNDSFVLQINAYLEQARIKLSNDLKQQLGVAVYEYFYKFIQQYPRLEETHLSTQIDRMLVTQMNVGDAVRHLKDSTSKLFNWLSDVLSRCLNISGDMALCKLINLLGGIFKRLLEQFSRIQRQLSLNVGGSATQAYSQRESNWSLLQYTLSLLECLADFQHRLQTFEQTLHERLKQLQEKLVTVKETSAINFYQALDTSDQQRLLNTIAEFRQKHLDTSQDNQIMSFGFFTATYDSLKTHFTETHDITLNILLQPLEIHLSRIKPSNELGQNHMQDNMPTFSFTPQESITQIGQYLLTLPQHLEPLLLAPSTLLKQALEMCNIKYSQPVPSVDVLLSLVVGQCCIIYQTQILQIKSLSSMAARQLAVDIEYLSSVIEELGLNLTTALNHILILLKAPSDSYVTLSVGCEPRLVSAIRQMRNINIITTE